MPWKAAPQPSAASTTSTPNALMGDDKSPPLSGQSNSDKETILLQSGGRPIPHIPRDNAGKPEGLSGSQTEAFEKNIPLTDRESKTSTEDVGEELPNKLKNPGLLQSAALQLRLEKTLWGSWSQKRTV